MTPPHADLACSAAGQPDRWPNFPKQLSQFHGLRTKSLYSVLSRLVASIILPICVPSVSLWFSETRFLMSFLTTENFFFATSFYFLWIWNAETSGTSYSKSFSSLNLGRKSGNFTLVGWQGGDLWIINVLPSQTTSWFIFCCCLLWFSVFLLKITLLILLGLFSLLCCCLLL